ncbi:permease [Achromobacter xylosoxidans]|uniref:sulfite exporter TauE/SafE family protein n=1 Tax=Alcaligenes xylosoxydans xylosoxydans TaxID=85698 RepID=UPI0006BF67E1|nr:sulfite exporter TauE/SafE family protein [Achromobacter xylosoxidans]OFL44474.1 permease [Achromobacter xylosoxidans]OFS45734.1 permease [Achromobacter xylosoxidans]PWV38835.1 sulfite exporter TauE/SafE family protein [Achromobacter xylosoxidans]CUI49131.1 Sulfite exporter TauE/SafE [Achromobacter xylosoxidans]
MLFGPMLWFTLGGAAVAGFVQGLSGFAFSMVSMAIWAWVLEPSLAAVLTVFGALVGQVTGALSVREAFPWKLLLPFLAGGALGVPIGLALLPVLDPAVFKLLLGIVLVAWCSFMLLSRRKIELDSRGCLGEGIAGLCGGILGSLAGLTGLAPALWCTLRHYPRDVQRNLIQGFNLLILSFTMTCYVVSSTVSAAMLPWFGALLPVVMVSTWLGARLYARLCDETFRRVVLMLLTLSGAALLVSSARAFL